MHLIKTYPEMTRRAFLSSRVIQAKGKFLSNMLVKIFGFLVTKMTRRAFLSSRVIQAQVKFASNMLVKIFRSLVTKMKISENLCIRCTSEQFPRFREVKTYPDIDHLYLSMRFRKIPTDG